jgi:PAS domain S-box-containing protein
MSTETVRRGLRMRTMPFASAAVMLAGALAVAALGWGLVQAAPRELLPWSFADGGGLALSGGVALLLVGAGSLLVRGTLLRGRAVDPRDAMLTHIEQGLLLIDPDQRVAACNRRALELLDLPETLMAARPHASEVFAHQIAQGEFDGIPAEVHDRIVRPILSQTPACYERMRPNGTVLEIRTVPLADGGAVRTYTDVTERRRAIDDMQASMAFAKSLINSSPDCIMLLDLAGGVTFVSDLGQELMEIDDARTVDGRPFVDFFQPEHRARVELALRRVCGGQTDRFTRPCATMGGVTKWWEFIITAVHDGGQMPERLFVVARDVSERQAQAEELGRAKEAAERASLAKSQFLASMSHEIRTPLNAILGFAALARDRQGQDAELSRHVELITKAGEALLTIINDVLDLSKIEAGKVELEERPLDLRGLVADCISLTQGLATAGGLRLDCQVDTAIPPFVLADEARLRQILLNLLNNAVKFTPAGSVSLSIASAKGGSGIAIAVTDTGIGIAAERLPHLFQDFVQVDGSISRQFGGTGLGLSISRRLAALMGGEISVRSILGEGSTFLVALPMTEAQPPSAETTTAGDDRKANTTPRRILLVDDVEINLEIVGEMLASAGHRVTLATSGPAAIAAYRDQRHELILMDVQMPDMDGLEATRLIRELDAEGRHVPVVALTANVFSEQVESYRRAGMDDHLGKPFRREALLAIVERWTGENRPPPSVAEEAAATEPVVDRRSQQELVELIGAEKALSLLARLGDDLPRRLRSAAPEALRADAHVMISSSGLLGFGALSAAARRLEQAIDAGDDIAAPLMQLLAARTAALAAIRESSRQIAALAMSHGGKADAG